MEIGVGIAGYWHRDQGYHDAAAWRGSDALDGGVPTSSPVGIPADVTVFCEHACISVGDYGIRRWDVPFAPPCEGAPGEPERSTGAWSPNQISGRGHVRQWTDVVAALREGRDPAVTGEAGLASAAPALSVRRSWREGRAVVPEYIGE